MSLPSILADIRRSVQSKDYESAKSKCDKVSQRRRLWFSKSLLSVASSTSPQSFNYTHLSPLLTLDLFLFKSISRALKSFQGVESIPLLLERSFAFRMMNELERAIQDANKAIEIDPANPELSSETLSLRKEAFKRKRRETHS